jgi:glutamyl-tRNA synthetase
MLNKVWKEDTSQIISRVKELLMETTDFSSPALEGLIKRFTEKNGLGFGQVAAPLRLLIVGSGMGPHLFDILEMIGKEESIRRISIGMKKLK